MTSHTSIIGHGRRKRGGFRWEQHGAPLDAFSILACQSELELAFGLTEGDVPAVVKESAFVVNNLFHYNLRRNTRKGEGGARVCVWFTRVGESERNTAFRPTGCALRAGLRGGRRQT